MTTERGHRITDADLMAYLDRSLDVGRAAEIKAALDADPEARSRLADWRQQNARIASLYGSVAAERVPPRLNVRVMAADRRDSRQVWARMAAVAIVCLTIGAAGGRYLARPVEHVAGDSMTEALAAHQLYAGDVAHPVAVIGNGGGALGFWLSKRLDRKLTIPNLEQAGWRLVGGSLVPAGAEPGAQIMYEDGGGRRLTLFFTPITATGDSTPHYATAGDLDAMSWTDGGLDCTIVGPIGRQDIKRIAAAVYEQAS
jgi:anti-sigma factor RsiW